MTFPFRHLIRRAFCIAVLLLPGGLVGTAFAQPPTAPLGFAVAIVPCTSSVCDFDVTLSWNPPAGGGAVRDFTLAVFKESIPVPGSPFSFRSFVTRVSSNLLRPGNYLAILAATNAFGSSPEVPISFVVPVSNLAPGQVTGVSASVTPGFALSDVTLSWIPPPFVGAGAVTISQYEIIATIPDGRFFEFLSSNGNTPSLHVGGLPPGTYTVSVRAINNRLERGLYSLPLTFVVTTGSGGGAPGLPTLLTPAISGSTVTLSWTPPATGGAPTGYDIEGVVEATGQIIPLSIGNQTSLTIPNVPRGNFRVRIRARNAFGASAFTSERLIVVGVTLQTGDMQVTMTWNTTTDMDLHVIEPDGTHVFFSNKTGRTARLDVDDTNGFGPENIFVGAGQAATGTYQVYLVHFSGSTPTTATIAITLFPNSPNERSAIFTRQTSAANSRLGHNVANVDIRSRNIVNQTGTRVADMPGDPPAEAKPEELPQGSGSR